MRYSKGICWIGDCRIPFVDSDKETINFDRPRVRASVNDEWILKQAHDYTNPEHKEYNTQGRFTPNLLVCDDMLNDGKTYGNLFKQNRNKDVDGGTGNSLVRAHKQGESNGVFDNGTSSSRFYDLDKWFDKVIDEIQ
jgi:hypothetical protein